MGADRRRDVDEIETAVREKLIRIGVNALDPKLSSTGRGTLSIDVTNCNDGDPGLLPSAQVIKADHPSADYSGFLSWLCHLGVSLQFSFPGSPFRRAPK